MTRGKSSGKRTASKPKVPTAADHRMKAEEHHAKARLHSAKADLMDAKNPPPKKSTRAYPY
jgi:hypothetical protein